MRLLIFGQTGQVARELARALPAGWQADFLGRGRADLSDPDTCAAVIAASDAEAVINAAAYTAVDRAEEEEPLANLVNGAAPAAMAVAATARGLPFVHVSTDYVFEGAHGDYREDDPPGPVSNYYALSKLAAEETARGALPSARLLVVRTSFRGRKWPHPKAFSDLFTSQDYVDVIAPQVALAICRAADIPHDTLHIASRRRSSLELARERSPGVLEASRAEAPVSLPRDISLNTDRWRALLAAWSAG